MGDPKKETSGASPLGRGSALPVGVVGRRFPSVLDSVRKKVVKVRKRGRKIRNGVYAVSRAAKSSSRKGKYVHNTRNEHENDMLRNTR